MTLNLPRWLAYVAAAIALVGLCVGLSAAVASMVADEVADDRAQHELRQFHAACIIDAMDQYLTGTDDLFASDPEPPRKPGSSARDFAWESYDDDFNDYEIAQDAWSLRYGEVTQEWIDSTRECLGR